MIRLTRLTNLLASLAFIGCASIASNASAGTLADINIVDRTTGERLQTWRHNGRYYIAGQPGNRYAIELANHTGGRLLTILSVDGVNAITGQTAATSQSGYVLDTGNRYEITGWRKNMNEVAAFYFTRLSDSYAARTGRPDNVGVIAVAVYREYVEPLPAPSIQNSWDGPTRQTPAAPAAKALGSGVAQEAARDATTASRAQIEEHLGTGHGERLVSHTAHTDFRRATSGPSEIVSIYYDSYSNLVAMGVIPRSYARPKMPQPFPGSFVPDPS